MFANYLRTNASSLTNVVVLRMLLILDNKPMTPYFRSLVVFCFCFIASASLLAQLPTNYVRQQEELPCLNKRFGLRIHIAEDQSGPVPFDTAAFLLMVETANRFYEPICVSFEACEFLSVENYRYSSIDANDGDEQKSIYGDPNRIDVFIPVFDSTFTCTSATPNGEATLGGILMNSEAFVAVNNSCILPLSTTLAHELGHYFGLLHTFDTDNGLELVDGSNCETAGDGICDTPADPFIVNSGLTYVADDDPCRIIFRPTDPNGQFYTPNTANVMSFYPMACHCGFTFDQLELMANNCLESGGGIY